MNIIQSATKFNRTLVPGFDFGPGTSAMVTADCTFAAPATAGNSVLAFVAARIPLAGSFLALGPALGASATAGSSTPIGTYYVQATYQDSGGTETMAGPEMVVTVTSAQTWTVFAPNNPNFSGGSVPGATGWNIYIGTSSGTEQKQNTSLLGFATNWTITGVTVSGIFPPSAPGYDTVGGSYTKELWVDANYSGTNQGMDGLGIFLCAVSPGGTVTFQVKLYAHNSNPFFGVNVDIDIILFEIAGFTDATQQGTAYFQQNATSGAPTLTMTGIAGNSIITHYSTISSCAGATIDLVSGSKDVVFAMLTGDFLLEPPITPTINTGAYTLLAHIPGSDGMPLYVWLEGPRKGRPQFFVVL